jgi:hypothetical protein
MVSSLPLSRSAPMPKAQRERRERTDNYHLLVEWCRTPEQRLYEQIRPKSRPLTRSRRFIPCCPRWHIYSQRMWNSLCSTL